MSQDEILAGVRTVIHAHHEVDGAVSMSTEIGADLKLDSLNQLALVIELENHFEICFEPGSEEGIVTVGDVVALIASQLETAA